MYYKFLQRIKTQGSPKKLVLYQLVVSFEYHACYSIFNLIGNHAINGLKSLYMGIHAKNTDL